jgi:hypothetical protein
MLVIAVIVGITAALLLGISTIAMRRQAGDIDTQLAGFGAVEGQVTAAYEAGRERYVKQEISDTEFADIIERDVLPPWHSIRFDPATLRGAPPQLLEFVRNYQEHHDLREQGWQLLARGLRTGDRQAIERGGQKFEQAKALLEKVSSQAKEKLGRAR